MGKDWMAMGQLSVAPDVLGQEALAALSILSGVSSKVACSAGVGFSPSTEACTDAAYF